MLTLPILFCIFILIICVSEFYFKWRSHMRSHMRKLAKSVLFSSVYGANNND